MSGKHVNTRLATLLIIACALLLCGCVQVVRPVVKIGLVAPFSGRYREVGYEVYHAVRLAVHEANLAGGINGYSVKLMSLDDAGNPQQARLQAEKMLADPQVVAIIGHWLDETTVAAAPLYSKASVPMLATSSSRDLPVSTRGIFRFYPTHHFIVREMEQITAEAGTGTICLCGVIEGVAWLDTHAARPAVGGPLWGLQQFMLLTPTTEEFYFVTPAPMPDDTHGGDAFAIRYRTLSRGFEPGWLSVLAYDATQTLLTAIDTSSKPVTPSTVTERLAQSSLSGLSRHISFDADGNWRMPHLSIYHWKDSKIVH